MSQETSNNSYTDPRTKIHKSNVINVDFYNKRKIDKKIVYQWVDASTGVVNNYDSSKEDNVAHVELPFFVGAQGKPYKVNCVFALDSLKDLRDDINMVLGE